MVMADRASQPQDNRPEANARVKQSVVYHALPIAEVVEHLATSPRGLSEAESRRRLEQYGPNELAQSPPPPRWKAFVAQFRSAVIGLLIVAAIISGALGEWIDAGAILAIVLLNGVLGFLQEDKARRALASLQKLSAPLARVLRAGTLEAVPARGLVPGDVIRLEAGDYIPADVRLLNAARLRAQEASLTGESTPTEKDADAVLAEKTALGDRQNMLYMGTSIAAGKADAACRGHRHANRAGPHCRFARTARTRTHAAGTTPR